MTQSEKEDFLNRFCHLEKDGEPYIGYQNKEGIQPVESKYIFDWIETYKNKAVDVAENEIYTTLKADKGIVVELPDPIEAIKFRIEQYGHNQTTASKAIGVTRSRLNEILHKRRHLSLNQIRKLVKYGIPLNVLIQNYKLASFTNKEETK